jgi:alkane 1-monooxygenase
MSRALKYLWAYIIPAVLVAVLAFRGWMSFAGLFVAFAAIPLLEFAMKGSNKNLTDEEEKNLEKKYWFDILLYLNVPIVWGITAWYFYLILNVELLDYEYIGINLSMGIFLGAMGINVAHELGHRNTWYEQLFAKLLLLPNLYTHFTIEHNRGHHVNVATPEDPATARYNEILYAFWFRSVITTFISAWRLEAKRLKSEGKKNISFHNEMIWLQVLQLSYLAVIYWIGGAYLLLSAIQIAVGGFLMLETVNYIEHYGLSRRKTETGRYERVQPWHSWNSNHDLGRIILYELTRHSDHHYKASRKYQILRHFDESPQLPFGYPTSMLMAFIPPLWFAVMNKRVNELKKQQDLLPLN